MLEKIFKQRKTDKDFVLKVDVSLATIEEMRDTLQEIFNERVTLEETEYVMSALAERNISLGKLTKDYLENKKNLVNAVVSNIK